MARRVFYSFHYAADSWRTSQVRNIGAVDGTRPAADNDWETVKRGGDSAIERWIDQQMVGTSCTVVLVGSQTAARKWVLREIEKTWQNKKALVGIHIHGLKDSKGQTSHLGPNPFAYVNVQVPSLWSGTRVAPLSDIVDCHMPLVIGSEATYKNIADNLKFVD